MIQYPKNRKCKKGLINGNICKNFFKATRNAYEPNRTIETNRDCN